MKKKKKTRSITGLVGWYSRQRPSHQLHSGFFRHKLSSGASAHTVSCYTKTQTKYSNSHIKDSKDIYNVKKKTF